MSRQTKTLLFSLIYYKQNKKQKQTNKRQKKTTTKTKQRKKSKTKNSYNNNKTIIILQFMSVFIYFLFNYFLFIFYSFIYSFIYLFIYLFILPLHFASFGNCGLYAMSIIKARRYDAYGVYETFSCTEINDRHKRGKNIIYLLLPIYIKLTCHYVILHRSTVWSNKLADLKLC